MVYRVCIIMGWGLATIWCTEFGVGLDGVQSVRINGLGVGLLHSIQSLGKGYYMVYRVCVIMGWGRATLWLEFGVGLLYGVQSFG